MEKLLLKMKQNKLTSTGIIIALVLASYFVISSINYQNRLKTSMAEYVKKYEFIDTWSVSGTVLTIQANDKYDKLDEKTKYEKVDGLYDNFSSALLFASNYKADISENYIKSKGINIKHQGKTDYYDYSGLKMADGKKLDSYDMDLSNSTPITSTSSTPTNDNSYDTEPSDDDKAFAWTAAIDTVKRNLKAPSTAKFPFSYYNQDIKKTSYDTFVVNSYVDAQNGFGAMIRSNFSVTIKKTGSNSYTVENLRID